MAIGTDHRARALIIRKTMVRRDQKVRPKQSASISTTVVSGDGTDMAVTSQQISNSSSFTWVGKDNVNVNATGAGRPRE